MAESKFRGKNGRFLPGNPGGPGNPQAARVAQLRAATLAAVTPAQMKRVMRSLVEKAIDGDVAAARLLLERCLGKEETTIFPSGGGMIVLPPEDPLSGGVGLKKVHADMEKKG